MMNFHLFLLFQQISISLTSAAAATTTTTTTIKDENNKKNIKPKYEHTHPFPSLEEEYDIGIFDPRHLFGAPYGGYARATRSRLASLPIRLVGGSKFAIEDEKEDEKEEEEEEKVGAEEEEEEEGGKEASSSSSSSSKTTKSSNTHGKRPHFVMRDGEGRSYACKVYLESDLESDSLQESAFDLAREQKGVSIAVSSSVHADKDKTSNIASVTEASETISSHHNTEIDHEDDRDRTYVKTSTSSPPPKVGKEETTETQQPTEKEDKSVFIRPSDIVHQLEQLKGICAHIHLGWWSYQWCHEDSVTQFHIAVNDEEVDDDETSSKVVSHFNVESVSTIGSYHGLRIVRVLNPEQQTSLSRSQQQQQPEKIDNDGHDQQPKPKSGAIAVTDSYDHGDWCEEGGIHRKMDVEIRCCREAEMNLYHEKRLEMLEKSGGAAGTGLDPNPKAILLAVSEDKREVCQYNAKVCTPLLCPDAFQAYISESEEENEVQPPKHDHQAHQDQLTGAEGNNRKVGRFNAQGTDKHNQQDQKDWTTIKKDESIRQILDRTLGDRCLTKNAGWWTYEFCHTRHVREYHSVNMIDQLTGATKDAVESEHFLGLYQTDLMEGYPNEQEVDHVINPNQDTASSSFSTKSKPIANNHVLGHQKPAGGAGGGNGAIFVQEYSHGDVCEHPDVTESIIKGGKTANGGIERSTTVRFSCGKTYDMVSVNEDSTCHYIVDVTVPLLCKHSLFKAPVVKTQVVKCLPV